MSPKQKAKELFDKYNDKKFYINGTEWTDDHRPLIKELSYKITKDVAKYCSIIAVDNELNFLVDKFDAYKVNDLNQFLHDRINYLEEVKKEIKSL